MLGPQSWMLEASRGRRGEEGASWHFVCVCDLARSRRVPNSMASSLHTPFLLPVDDDHRGDDGSPQQIAMMREMMTTTYALCGTESSLAVLQGLGVDVSLCCLCYGRNVPMAWPWPSGVTSPSAVGSQQSPTAWPWALGRA